MKVHSKLRRTVKRVLRRIFGPKMDEVTGGGKELMTISFMIYAAH
jgi:hypothetical protein